MDREQLKKDIECVALMVKDHALHEYEARAMRSVCAALRAGLEACEDYSKYDPGPITDLMAGMTMAAGGIERAMLDAAGEAGDGR